MFACVKASSPKYNPFSAVADGKVERGCALLEPPNPICVDELPYNSMTVSLGGGGDSSD